MDLGNKDRKKYLERQGLINCGICPYHRGENARSRRPKPDKYKNKRRVKDIWH